MAGDWIKMRKCLPDDPAVIAIGSMLGLDADQVLGKLYRLWSWADTHCDPVSASRPGHAPRVTSVWIDEYLRVTNFADTLREIGWLDIERDGIAFPKFDRHMSESAKERALAQKRKAEERSRKRHAPRVTREEKRREEKKDTPNGVSIPLPPELETEAFKAAWTEWLAYRRERSVKTTPRTIKSQFALLAQWGPELAIEALQASIRNGWQGIFDPREKRNGKSSSAAAPGAGIVYDPNAAKRDPNHGKW